MRFKIFASCLFLGLCISWGLDITEAQVHYIWKDLGTLGGDTSGAYGINDAGHVVGASRTANSVYNHAFLWKPETGMQDLGTLGGAQSRAQDINNLGEVVGDSDTSSNKQHAFIWSSTAGMQDLGKALSSDYQLIAFAINNCSQVVGFRYNGWWSGGFIWTPSGGMQALPYTFMHSAQDINDRGQIVGGSYLLTPESSVQDLDFSVQDLGFVAYSINDSGHVVGNSGTPTTSQAYLWQPDEESMDLGSLGGGYSRAQGINNAGHVVGQSLVNTDIPQTMHAFIWTPENGMQDLGTLGGYSEATAINNLGQIVGCSRITGGTMHAFLATPQTLLSGWVQELIQAVLGLNLPKGTETSLVRILEDAQHLIDKGNAKAAAAKLNACIKKIEKESGKTMTEEQADGLIAAARRIMAFLL